MSDNTQDVQTIRQRLEEYSALEKRLAVAGGLEADRIMTKQGLIEEHYYADVSDLLDQLDAKDTEIATKDAQIAERDATIAKMAAWMRLFIRQACWGDTDGGDVQDEAVKSGFLREEWYDPKEHPDIDATMFEEGDIVYVFDGPLKEPNT